MMSESDSENAKRVYQDPQNWNRFVDVINSRDHGSIAMAVEKPNLRIGFESRLRLDIVGVRMPGRVDRGTFDDISSPEDLPFVADRMIVDPPNDEEFEVLFELRGTSTE